MIRDLKRFSLLSELGEDDLAILDDLLEERALPKGRQLCREGQESDGLVLVDAGTLRLSSKRAGDLGVLEAGESFGALSLVVVGPREATVKAEEPTTILTLSRTAFHRFAEDAPRAAVRLLEVLVQDSAAMLRTGIDRLVD